MAARKPTPEAAEPVDGLLSIDIEVNGQTKALHFKSFNQAPIGIFRKTKDNITQQMWALFEWALTPQDLNLLDLLPIKQVWSIHESMQEASKVELGE